MRSNRSLCAGISLSLASLFAFSTLTGCAKLDELTGNKEEAAKSDDSKKDAEEADGGEKGEDGGALADAKEAAEAVVPPVVEPIPVEALHTGLDLMLTLVPEGSEFIIARDATVVTDYVDEATRFLDGPMAKLKTGPMAGERDLQKAEASFEEAKKHVEKVKGALVGSGIDLKEGAAVVKAKGGDALLVYHASNPNALPELGKVTGEADLSDLKCKAIESAPGFNVCADSQKAVDNYKPSESPDVYRSALAENLPGIDLDEANMVAHVDAGKKDEVWMSVSTIPGTVHMAVNMPNNDDMVEIEEGMQPGPAKTLAQVQPGAGFIWAHMSPDLLKKSTADAKGTPGEAVANSLTGEFVLAGSVDPGGLIMQFGTTDTAGVEALLGMGFDLGKDAVPKEIPDVPGSVVAFEKVPIEGGGKTAQALHVGVSGIPEADVLKGYTGVHLDGWAFAANDVFTLALGPDAEHVNKLLDVPAGGPSTATLASLPKALADGLGRNEVGMIVHVPLDFLHGKHMHELVKASLKEVSEVPADQILAMTSLAAPFSSTTMWISKPGDKPVVHIAVQAVGHLATDEGRAALDAAHTVADGGDPAVAFASLASTYVGSPMAYAYKTRSGVDGPGYLVGSGFGAVAAAAAVVVPVVLNSRSETLASDLGVTVDTPEPVLEPTDVPAQPIIEPVEPVEPEPVVDPVEPKPDPVEPKPDPVEPKPDPVEPKPDPVEPKKPEPTKDEPIVEPKPKDPKPLPPKPTKDPKKPTKKKRPVRMGRNK